MGWNPLCGSIAFSLKVVALICDFLMAPSASHPVVKEFEPISPHITALTLWSLCPPTCA